MHFGIYRQINGFNNSYSVYNFAVVDIPDQLNITIWKNDM